MVPSVPVTPGPPVGVPPAGTVSAGHAVMQPPVHALVPLSFTSSVKMYTVMPLAASTRIVPASPTSSASTVTAAADVAGGAADGGAWVATGGTVAATVGFVVAPGVQAAATTSTARRPTIELVRLMLGLPRAGKGSFLWITFPCTSRAGS